MTTKEINQSIESMNLFLTKDEQREHWLNLVFLLIPIFAIGYVVIDSAIQNEEFLLNSLIFIGLVGITGFLILHKIRCRQLDVYKSNLSEDQFKKANEAAAKLNDWIIISSRKDYFSAIKTSDWQWEGIKITAILKNDKLYLNSMVNPSNRSNPFNFGLNKKNKMDLIKQYQFILKGNDVTKLVEEEIKEKEEEFWNESEWTLKNTLKRILGYGLSIPFLVFAIILIKWGEIQALISGITIIVLCGSYIYNDIKVILEKKKKSNQQNM